MNARTARRRPLAPFDDGAADAAFRPAAEPPAGTLDEHGTPGEGSATTQQELQAGWVRLQAQLGALRGEGAPRFDPVGFHAMESLARRLPDQPEPVRRLLQGRLRTAVTAFSVRWAETREAATAEPARRAAIQPEPARELQGRQALDAQPQAAALPLQQLNQYIRAATGSASLPGADSAVRGETLARGELTSARRFRQAWTRSRIADQVALAVSRPPANAGPLNSHRLLLQALDRMRELSPDYLQHFVAQAESLRWLARAGEQYPPAPSGAVRPARRGRVKK